MVEQQSNWILQRVGSSLRFPERGAHYLHSKTTSHLHEFYSKIPKDLMDKIYEKYKYDFELFDFDKTVWMK